MLTEQRLPPSGRDFEVYELVILGGKSTRETAEKFKLSQTRVCQIVERMRAWQAEVLPAESTHAPERLQQLAKNVASGRLDHLYCETMEAWRQSQGDVKRTRSSRFGDDVTTTFFSPGDPKYLIAAMRLATTQAELGAFGGLACPPEEDVAGRPEARPTEDHPAGDCSENCSPQPASAPAPASATAATASAGSRCDELSEQQAIARRRFFGPVHRELPAGDNPPVAQVQVTPDELGLSVDAILSRQKRRALKRARRAG